MFTLILYGIISLTIYVKIADLIHVKKNKNLKSAKAPTFCGIVAQLIGLFAIMNF